MSNHNHHDTGQSPWITPFNVIAGLIVLMGIYLTYLRFTGGLAAVTNLDDYYPWGIWISFDLLCGVALAAGGYTTAAACYIFGIKKYHAAVRPAVLTAFLGYALVVFALHYDVGQPWRLAYPIFVQQGTTSVLFEVGLCVFLYLTVLFLEWLPAPLEWLKLKRVRNIVIKLTLVLTVFGVILSTMHQSSLGALYLILPSKMHPLWFSSHLPIYFFVSSMFAGLSMVIFESTLSHRYYHNKMDKEHLEGTPHVTFGFAKAAAWIMAGYFFIKLFGVVLNDNWGYLPTFYGFIFSLEMLGFVALPAFLYAKGVRDKNVKLIKWTAVLAVFGIIFNRFNVSLVAYNYHLPSELKYFPALAEIGVTIFVVTVGLILFKLISTRMPIFYEHPDFKGSH
ncbi:sulfate respiration complex protein HmcC [Desulfonatronospira sp.]|uniref:sulfate respiration complex protein HmcC n=1 Tax=Desulfonatronospira sp. TaxID=1962951 RepID=UPI0025C2E2CD|nr:Ni/Fe-hydrogenase cytochrome b subunit [Desulfonatronospira sp.]